jgi:hypothetical protein
MLFSASHRMQWLSKQSLLIAFFFVFSFNHIVLTKYHFVLGQASFYFIAFALLMGYFPIFKAIPKRSLFFFAIFLIYCLGSAGFFCWTDQGVCSTRPYTAAISLVFVFLFAQYTAYVTQHNPGFAASAEKYLVAGAWALVLLSIPDIAEIACGGVITSVPYGLDFLSPIGIAPYYGANRLRAFTQEPSYLGMVIATLYPICFYRLNEKFSLARTALVFGLWVCLIYSVSRTGILTCFIFSILILLGWPKRLFISLILLLALACFWLYLPQLWISGFWSFNWVPLLNKTSVDGSTLVRSAHIWASINAWLANPQFGFGLGQSGFVLPQFYPDWYTSASIEYEIWAPKSIFGGTPSLSFLPKLLAEIGLIGVVILLVWALPSLRDTKNIFKNNNLIRKYALAFAGFLLASFGVEGYLYLPAWLIFALILGMNRNQPN